MKTFAGVCWACDTEVANIDVKDVGPVGNGQVVCVSIFGGPEVDLGEGPNKALWIEDIDEAKVSSHPCKSRLPSQNFFFFF
jgi:DNA polymerase-1